VFETAELGREVSRREFKAQVPKLRTELLELQQQMRSAGFAVIAVFAGVDGAGKSETVNVLNEWMDPRGFLTRAFDPPTPEEQERPISGATGWPCPLRGGSAFICVPGTRSPWWTGCTTRSTRRPLTRASTASPPSRRSWPTMGR